MGYSGGMLVADSPPRRGAQAHDAHPALEGLPPRTVFFDGVCNFCDRSVQWLLAHDPDGRLHFAPHQGPTAERLRAELPDFPSDLDSIVYLDASGPEPRITRRSRAVFAILDELEGTVPRFRVLRVLPEWLADLGYRAFARVRYRIFGRRDTCAVPTPEQRQRFLP